MVQEIIPGDAKTSYGLNAYYDKKSNPHGIFIYRRIREWPHGFGNGCYIEKVDFPEIKDFVNSFIQKIGFHGIIDAELKLDSRDKKINFIEINPRIWMQVSLSHIYLES